LELVEKGIIEITRDKPTPSDFADRKANIYRMLPLSRQQHVSAYKTGLKLAIIYEYL